MNEAREKLETMIYCFCKCYGLKLPRRYRKRARKEYLAFAKSRKHKVKAPVEFGAKFDLSLDSEGYGRIEKISFEAYNESTCLIEAIERFRERTGYYPERVLADQIYRTRETGAIARNMESGYQVQSWADQALQQKLIRNRSIRIIPIESKWSAP